MAILNGYIMVHPIFHLNPNVFQGNLPNSMMISLMTCDQGRCSCMGGVGDPNDPVHLLLGTELGEEARSGLFIWTTP